MAASKTGLKTLVFLGSTREGRNGLRVAKFIQKQLQEADHVAEIIDPVELPFPLLEKPLHWYRDASQIPPWMTEVLRKIKEADAYVVVSAEYNHSIPPALSNMLDHFPSSAFSYKPSGIVTYSLGPFGGVRASVQLRSLLGELGCLSVSNMMAIPTVHQSLDPEGKPLDDRLVPSAKNLIKQLDWHGHAMKTHRETHGVPK